MKNILIAFSFLSFNIISATPFLAKSYTIDKTSQSVTIDGDLSEWSNIQATPSFLNHETSAQGTAGAYAKLMWDANNLYIAFSVTDADITANYVNNDANIFDNDDLVEMFFDFDGSGTNYLELGVSATGVYYDFNIICPGTGGCGSWNSNTSYNITGLSTATMIDGTLNNSADVDNGYTVEIKIPLTSLTSLTGGNYTTVQEGTMWNGNLFKINYNTGAGTHAGTDYLSWSQYGSFGFHQPSKFGTFTFGGLTVGNDKVSNPNINFHAIGQNMYKIKSNQEFSIKIIDTLGKAQRRIESIKESTLNLNSLPKGVYFIESIQNNITSTEKVIVK